MAYTNSPLVNYTKISPNKTANRTHSIDTITIHCVVGQCTVEALGNVFADSSRQASSNYGVGYDGKIGMYVEEKDRSWCSSNATNDHRAITIEVASDTTSPYAVTTKAYNALIELVADICKRNNIKELKWKADKSLIGQVDKQNMTVHKWFANKDCPGDYLYERMGAIATAVNKKLGTTTETKKEETAKTETVKSDIKKGDLVSVSSNATYYDNGKNVPKWVKAKKWYVAEVNGDRAVIDKSEDGENAIASPINVKFLTTVKEEKVEFKPYKVRVTAAALNIRKGAGMKYDVADVIRDKGIYTIVEENNGWGKLKSGAGWINLDYTAKL